VLVTSTIYPFIFSKITFFRILSEVALAAWIPLALGSARYRPNWRHPIVLWLSAFIGMMVVTMLTGVDPARSFWSTQERMTGVLTMLHFWAWFLVLISVFRTWKWWRWLLYGTLVVSVILGMIGFDTKQVLKSIFESANWQMNATLGNPIYVGSYALFHIFLALIFIFTEKKWLRSIAIFFAIFNFFTLFLAASRGPLFALIGSAVLFFLILLIILPPSRYRRTIQFSFLGTIACIVLALVVLTTPFGEPWGRQHLPFTIKKIIYFPTLETLTERAGFSTLGIKGFLERPLFGWGWENFPQIYDKYYEPVLYGVSLRDTFIDRSHNQMVDVLSLTGIGGFISYILLWLWIVILLLKRIFDKNSSFRARLAYTAVALFFASYFVQNLSIFDTPAALIVFYLSLAFLYFITSDKTAFDGGGLQQEQGDNRVALDTKKLAIIAVTAISLPFAIYYLNIRSYLMSFYTHSAVESIYTDFAQGMREFRLALGQSDYTNSENRMLLFNTFLPTLSEGKLGEKSANLTLPFLAGEIQKELHEFPDRFRTYLTASRFYRNTARYNPEFADKALSAALRGKLLSPKRIDIYYELAEIYALKGEFDKAVDIAQQVVKLDSTRSESYFLLTVEAMRNKSFDLAFGAAKKAGELGYPIYNDQNIIQIMQSVLPNQKKIPEAINFMDRVVLESPRNYDYLAARAVVYYKAGEEKIANVYLYDLKRRDPESAARAEEFIKNLSTAKKK